MLSAVSVGASQSLAEPEIVRPIDPLSLKCTLRDRKFLTEINFSLNAQQELVGEVANYVTSRDHGRQYLSGSVLFEITPGETVIEGSTGDPRASVSHFRLIQLGLSANGFWVYEHFENSRVPERAKFICTYPAP
ncbi:MAG: hypothetical protein EBX52_07335 [Proteobacteria bacterium]|nr:hypothetical protein [Pseudomonadota bacterium]